MGTTYKQAGINSIVGLLKSDPRDLDVEYKLRKDLKSMTGHGLARLRIEIEDFRPADNKVDHRICSNCLCTDFGPQICPQCQHEL